ERERIIAFESDEDDDDYDDDDENSSRTTRSSTADLGRTDDPVRLYLREMGSVELLSREGEIELAKRIEAGRQMIIGSLVEFPFIMRQIAEWYDALDEETLL